jgi:hypothetical protein
MSSINLELQLPEVDEKNLDAEVEKIRKFLQAVIEVRKISKMDEKCRLRLSLNASHG